MKNQVHPQHKSHLEHRKNNTDLLTLVEVAPVDVVDGIRVDDGYLADDVVDVGTVRETCPECKTVHLKLVLLQPHVGREHMYCEACTRCFDVRYRDGVSALG
jgi:hypothetical protein